MEASEAFDRYFDLVRKIASSIHRAINRSVELDELVSMGVQGLLEAASRADPELPDRFASYAALRVRGAILDSLGNTASLPRKSHRMVRAGRLAARPTPVDPRVLEGRHAVERPAIDRAIDGRRAWRAAGELPAQTREMLQAIYIEGRTLTEVARQLGVSVSWVSRRHQRALAALRATLDGSSEAA